MGERSNHSLDKLAKRIDAIITERPSHKEVLEFLKGVMTEQYKIRSKVKTDPVEINEEKVRGLTQGFSLVGKKDLNLDTASAIELFERLCKVLGRNKRASGDVKRIKRALRNNDMNLVELFKHVGTENDEYISALSKKLKVKDDLLSFLAGNSIRPIFEAYASQLKGYVDQEMWWRGYCPICGSMPFIAEFREEGERFLACSSCSFEWRFMRLKCPFCEAEDDKELRYFYAEGEGKAHRVDVCEKCKRYIKTLDIREMAGEVIPIIEDMGTLYLDVLAQKEGYLRGGITHSGLIN
jgi:FdhE protein